ncbi:MAG TPA: alkaline phosphatase family protein [Solirubrobacterales bacterium]|nr:alkaline phosphatase family protein [Solirubrobacterales bacterium]
MKALTNQFQRAMAAAATLTGKRFGLLVASSLVATSAIVAAAMTGTGAGSPLAGLLAHSLAADRTPALTAPAPTPEPAASSAGSSAQPAPEAASAPVESAPAPAPLPAPEATPASDPESTEPTTPAEPAPEAGRIKHVFVISLASSGYEAAFGTTTQMPYLAGTLRPQGDLLSGYSLLDTAALPNSIATISGQPPTAASKTDCPDYGSCVYSAETLTLADQLDIAQFSWRAYMEDMVNPETGKPDNCVYPQPGAPESTTTGGYSPSLNPFVYFHSLLDLGDCSANDVPFTGLEKDLKKVDSTPNYSYISPNLCNAGVAAQCAPGTLEGAASADAFLAQLAPKILASPAYKKDGLLIVDFGQVNPADPAAPAPAKPLKVGALLVSPFVSPNSTDAVAYSPYSLLRSTEDLFGLGHLADAEGAKVKSFAPPLLGKNAGD